MKFYEFSSLVQNVPPGMRRGQYLINCLYNFNPKLYQQLPVELDVFYSDEKCSDLMIWLKTHWEE